MLTDQQVISEAIRVVNESFVGLMTTVDAQGMPHARWMGTATLADGLHQLFTLSGRKARKLEHLQANPNVCWVFSSADQGDVVTLYGTARMIDEPLVMQSIWDRLVDCAQTYVMSNLDEDSSLEMVTIETQVTRIEYLSPRKRIYQPRTVELAPRT